MPQVYLIDFGLSKRYVEPRTNQHIPYRTGKSLTGAPICLMIAPSLCCGVLSYGGVLSSIRVFGVSVIYIYAFLVPSHTDEHAGIIN